MVKYVNKFSKFLLVLLILSQVFVFTSDSITAYDHTSSDQPIPAIYEYVPEMKFAEDMLIELEEEEIFESITALSGVGQGIGAGLVQFVLEPVASSLPSGVSMAQARAAAFNARTIYHPLFASASAGIGNTATSINGRYGRDALFLGTSANGNRYRVLIAGFEGYVDRIGGRNTCGAQRNQACMITVPVNGVNRTFEVTRNAVFVPFGNYPTTSTGNVQTMSHYVNRNGELFRYLTNNVNTPGGFTRFLVGTSPSWMTQNTRYYSYDGVYFYRNPRNIRVNGSGAVNANNPHFNYFQYLSFRSASTITASQLNTFLVNSNNNSNWHSINTTNSVMRNQGNAFINAQNRFGINALLMYAKAMHESAGGTSTIAINNNNLFGQGAIDAAPGTNAWHFETPAASINNLADGWLSRGYLWPSDWRYAGPHVGHKGSGMNVRYATDPYWGQKIAGWAFRIDRAQPAASREINREQIAIRQNTSSIAVTNSSGTTLYTANPRQARYFPFLVTATATNNRLRILTDPAIVNGVANQTAQFNRNNAVGYIPNSNVWFVGSSPIATAPRLVSRLRTAVTVANVNFRTGPGTNHGIIATVSANTNVRINGMQGDWYRIRHDGQTGWMHRDLVQETRQRAVVRTDNVAVHASRNSNSAVLTRVNSGTRLIIARRSANWSRVTVNGHTGWIRNTNITMNNAARPGRVTANVNVHVTPQANSNVLRRLPRNAEVMILQRTTNGTGVNQGWTQVRIQHNNATLTGWVRTNQIELTNHTRRITGTNRALLRSGPGTSFNINHRINPNTQVTLLAQTGSWSRVRVRINGRNEVGWIGNSRISRLPLPAQP